jgi:molecular chaperone GrpE
MKNKRKEEPKEQKESILRPPRRTAKDEPETQAESAYGGVDQLVDKLLQQKDELFDEMFLTKDDNELISSLPKELREPAREALLRKGVLFRKLHDKLLRVSADYANFQKRAPKQISDTILYEKEKIIKTLLPVLDNFEHTLQNEQSVENTEAFVKGVRIIYDQMLDILKSHGVEQIQALGEKFDPALHQAMLQQSKPEQEEDIVLQEFQKGYKLNGRVVRPSKVIVNKLSPEKPAEEQIEGEQKSQQESIDLQEQTNNEHDTADT